MTSPWSWPKIRRRLFRSNLRACCRKFSEKREKKDVNIVSNAFQFHFKSQLGNYLRTTKNHYDIGDTIRIKIKAPRGIIKVPNETPMTFNGDDRVGLFKNDVLIDIIGDLNGTDDFGKDITLRRNSDVTEPTTNYSEQAEWSFYERNNTSDIGNFNGTLSTENNFLEDFKMYPNPSNGNDLFFNSTENIQVIIFNVLGKKVKSKKLLSTNKRLNISELSKGIYLIKISSDKASITKKLIKN